MNHCTEWVFLLHPIRTGFIQHLLQDKENIVHYNWMIFIYIPGPDLNLNDQSVFSLVQSNSIFTGHLTFREVFPHQDRDLGLLDPGEKPPDPVFASPHCPTQLTV